MISRIRETKPLIHCITNPISINQCANAILALGARPVMAEHPEEVSEITLTSEALLLNLGNITDVRMDSMRLSAKTANENGIPFVIDLVGVACSDLRRKFAIEIIKLYHPSVIKGNYSEINALYDFEYKAKGVDSETKDKNFISKIAIEISKTYKAVVVASGETDVVTDGIKTVYVKNGSKQLAQITGTGCMLGALCACFMAVGSITDAVPEACITLGICGEQANSDKGSGSFSIKLLDNLSLISDKDIKKHQRTEVFKVEEI